MTVNQADVAKLYQQEQSQGELFKNDETKKNEEKIKTNINFK